MGRAGLLALFASGCVIPKLELMQGDAGTSEREAGVGQSCVSDAGTCDGPGSAGKSGRGADSAGRGGRAAPPLMGGAGAGGSAGQRGPRGGAGAGAGAGGTKPAEGGAGASGAAGDSDPEGAAGGSAGGTSGTAEPVGGWGGAGDPVAGEAAAGEPAAGEGGDGAGGQGGAAGAPVTPDPCFSWRPFDPRAADPYAGLIPRGVETNGIGTVDLYVCRARPDGRSDWLLGKAIPSYGCYGTFDDGASRAGFGVTEGFQLLDAPSDCLAFSPADSAPTFDLDSSNAQPLVACRGRLDPQPYDGGVASGQELGQWVPAGGGYACWIQFFGTAEGMDRGSLRLTEALELLGMELGR
ncbi:MAG: hypothetical protein ABW321_19930 [Polyangiales bacterium]